MRSVWTIIVAAMTALALSGVSVRADDKEPPEKAEGVHAPAPGHPVAGGHEPAAHDEHEKPNPTALYLDLTIWTIVVFLLTFFILARFAWKPMLEGLKAREKTIQDAQDNALKAQHDAQKLQLQLQAEMNSAQEKVRELLENARKDATKVQEEMLTKAKAEIQAERQRLTHDLEMARDQALRQIWDRAATLAVEASEKALRRQLGADDQRRLIEEAIVDLRRASTEHELHVTGSKA